MWWFAMSVCFGQKGIHMNKLATSSLFLFIFVCGLPTSGSSQWSDNMGGNWNNPTGASVGNIINDQLWNRVFAKARARDKTRAKQPSGSPSSNDAAPVPAETSPKTPAQIDAAVRFRSTGTQLETQAIADELGAGGTPDAKKQMFTVLSTLLTEYEKAARTQGKPNDLALAITAALVYNGGIYNGTPEPADARIMEIRDALAELAVEDGTFAALSDRQKQVLYEKLVISTMLAKAGYEDAKEKGDKTNMAIYRNLSGRTLQAVSGMSPEKINFTGEFGQTEIAGTPTANTSGEPIEHYVLLQDFRDNQVAAEAKYNGKRVKIVGPVDFVLIENGLPVLRMGVPAWSGRQMFCVFPVSQKPTVANVQVNQRVVMECTVLGYAGGVSRVGRVDLGSSVGRLTLNDCAFVQ
jgi:hypothetical protein